MEGVNWRQRVHLTGTTLNDGFVIRICVLSFRTHQHRLEMALEDIEAEILARSPAPRTVGSK
jgi:aromatic-L-amino-acid decarboxylase